MKEYKVIVTVSNAEDGEEEDFEFYVHANSIEEAVDNVMEELDM